MSFSTHRVGLRLLGRKTEYRSGYRLSGVPARANMGNDGRLIIPGRSPPSQPGRLIVPGERHSQRTPGNNPGRQHQQNAPSVARQFEESVAGLGDIPAPRNFRPPAGFMDKNGPVSDPFANKSSDEVVAMLASRSDYWYNLAMAFPRLYADNFDRTVLEELVNIDPSQQNVWCVAADVFRSLKASGQLSKEQLDYYNAEAYGPACLKELRILDAGRRIECARYVADQQLGPTECAIVARAIKEHQRRPDSNAGFTEAAGDCLAFKYFRDAGEVRSDKDRDSLVEKGLSVAVSESAIQRLLSMRQPREEVRNADDNGTAPSARMATARLQKDDIGSRLIPLAGTLGDADANAVANVPTVGGNGVFQAVRLPQGGGKAITLPRWNVVALARRPAALFVNNVCEVPEILESFPNVKTDKDKQKMRGPALMLLDVDDTNSINPSSYYVVSIDNKACLCPGHSVQNPIARVLLACLPPRQQLLSPDAFDL